MLPEAGAPFAGGMLDGAAMPVPGAALEGAPFIGAAPEDELFIGMLPEDEPFIGALPEDGVLIGMVLSPVAEALPPRAAARLFAFSSSVDGSPARLERVFGPCM